MKLRIACVVLATLCSTGAAAHEVAMALGPGVNESSDSSGYFLQYRGDAWRWREVDVSYVLSLGNWTGDASATIVAASGSLRWRFEDRGYARFSVGAGYLDHTTKHLGTHGQFMEQVVIGRELGVYDLGAGFVHISNGDSVLRTGQPNAGETFFTIELGRRY